ncbi:MAG: FAD-dependent oxidoreductase, partial [Myxococcota bacterium]|nr:FAD-dependent oxidoreductase [Myxococcota bacterium]
MSTPSLPGVADRDSTLDRAERETFDLAVIGGGITGAGIAREAALRGLSVALLEARDFASGTSSRSSKLIHGGLRYLAMGDVALVRS